MPTGVVVSEHEGKGQSLVFVLVFLVVMAKRTVDAPVDDNDVVADVVVVVGGGDIGETSGTREGKLTFSLAPPPTSSPATVGEITFVVDKEPSVPTPIDREDASQSLSFPTAVVDSFIVVEERWVEGVRVALAVVPVETVKALPDR